MTKPAKSSTKAPASRPSASRPALRTSAAARKAPAAKPSRGKASKPETEAPAPSVNGTAGLEGAMKALAIALDKKALEPVLLDVRDLCSFCNYQLVVSGRSDRQLDAIADGISSGLKAEGIWPLGKEGASTGQWSLLDFGDFVVHVFVHSAREHFDLEGLWSDAPRVPIEVPDEARITAADAY